MSVFKLVVTGGPCAGKSTAIPLIKRALEEEGNAVAVAPEAATILLEHGYGLRTARGDGYVALQKHITLTQLALEKAQLASLALDPRPGVLLCDRGVHDNRAYMTRDQWELVEWLCLPNNPASAAPLYDGVLHLVTAAWEAPEHYQNTAARTESVEVARELESKTWHAWDHYNAKRLAVGGQNGFAKKMEAAVWTALFLVNGRSL